MRLANIEKAGFFPLPDGSAAAIASHINRSIPKGARIYDPCAGKGVALKELALATGMTPYGAEINEDRGAEAKSLIDLEGNGRFVISDAHFVRCTDGAFQTLYLNPPYMLGEKGEGRQEHNFLLMARPQLQAGGLLVYVVPQHILSYTRTARYIAAWFEDVRIYRLPGDDYDTFKQVVLFATRKQKITSPRAEVYNYMEKLGAAEKDELPELVVIEKPVYTIPAPQSKTIEFRSSIIRLEDALNEAKEHGVETTPDFQKHLQPKQLEELDPLMPLKVGHMVGVLAAGHLNDKVLEIDDDKILIKGQSTKTVQTAETIQEGETKDGEPVSKKKVTHTERYETQIAYVQDGKVKLIEGAELAPFMEKWLPAMTDIVAEEYAPRYQFKYGKYMGLVNTLNKNRVIPRTNGRTGLLPAQKHAVAAAAMHLEEYENVFIVGEMGTGKTLMGTGVIASQEDKFGNLHAMILCPPHLVKKWKREIKIVWPEATAVILEDQETVDRFFEAKGPIVGILKETKARAASGWSHAYQTIAPEAILSNGNTLHSAWRSKRFKKFHEVDEAYKDGKLAKVAEKREQHDPFHRYARIYQDASAVRCPTCGEIQQDKNELNVMPNDLKKRRMKCQHCREPLWQEERRKTGDKLSGSFKEYIRREKEILAGRPVEPWTEERLTARYGKAGTPLATYIKTYYKEDLHVLVADECHQYKSGGSDRGYAFHQLTTAAKKNVMMTGTIYGGKASTLFWLLYRGTAQMRDEYNFGSVSKWVAEYGRRQWDESTTLDKHGRTTGNLRRTAPQEMPGASPAMLHWIINRSVFVSLRDMGEALPPYTEEAITVSMSPEQAKQYAQLDNQISAEMKQRLVRGDKSLLGAYLQALLTFPDSSWRPKKVTDPKDRERIIGFVPGIESGDPFPKEQRIIDDIKECIENGRRVLLFVQQTGTLDITPKWVQWLQNEGLRPAVLRADTSTREQWVKDQVAAGINVLITHPRKVETGLDLLEFPELMFSGTEYSVYTIAQASRRSWRIGQEHPVRVRHYVYEETLQETAMQLIASKLAAAARVNGDEIDSQSLADLDEMAEGELMDVLGKVATGEVKMKKSSVQAAFAAANKEFKNEDAQIGSTSSMAEEDETAVVVSEPTKLPPLKPVEPTAVTPENDNAHDLIPAHIKLPKIYGTENIPTAEKIIHIKLFTPDSSWTWLLTEYSPEDNEAFGYAYNSAFPEGAEWGYIPIGELSEVTGHHGLKVERDLWWKPKTFWEAAQAERMSPNCKPPRPLVVVNGNGKVKEPLPIAAETAVTEQEEPVTTEADTVVEKVEETTVVEPVTRENRLTFGVHTIDKPKHKKKQPAGGARQLGLFG